jgi:hypothetical protein
VISISKMKIACVSIVSLILISTVLAGPRVGNGGGAWVCQEPTGEHRWVRLVDLFEAENEFGLKLAPVPAKDPWALLQERYEFIFANVPELANILTLNVDQLHSILHMVPQYTELTRIDDDQIRIRPASGSCDQGILYYGQIADYTFDDRLLVAGDLWGASSFTDTDRAALLMHEVVYKTLRDHFGDTDSSRARAIVGLVFSDLNTKKIASGVTAVLARGNSVNPDSSVTQGAFKLVCFAHIESEVATTVPGQVVYLEAGSTPGLLSTKFQGISFTVKTEAAGSPTQLAISDMNTGVRSITDEQSTGTAFKRDGRVALSLEFSNTNQVVFLECRAM